MRFMVTLLLLLASTSHYARESYPTGCYPISLSEQKTVLKYSRSALILIQNVTKGDIWLTHPVSEPSASAGWSSLLSAKQWSALALKPGPFELSCVESQPGHEQVVACKDVVKMCKWKKAQFPPQLSGTFWAAENLTLEQLTEHLAQRGFVLPEWLNEEKMQAQETNE